jgi:ketosteroid isomerase-like protein
MKRAIFAALLLCLSNCWAATMPALDATAGRPEDRQQLRVLLGNVESAISNLQVEEVIKLMHPDVIVTWQNAEVSRGPEQIRAYYNRMMKGNSPIVKKFSTQATLGGNAAFYGDTAVAYGTTVDNFELMEGLSFSLHGNWSTTVVKTDGQWKIAALHFSTNLFDNPLLNKAKQMAWYAGLGGLLAGMLLMLLVGRLRKKS